MSKIIDIFTKPLAKKRKTTLIPEHYVRDPGKLAECILPDIPFSPYDRSKIRKLMSKDGLWWSIILDETEAVIGGFKVLKTIKDKAQTAPVVCIPNLTTAQKVACRKLSKEWEGDHGLWFF